MFVHLIFYLKKIAVNITHIFFRVKMSLYDEFESYLKFKTFAAQETETITVLAFSIKLPTLAILRKL